MKFEVENNTLSKTAFFKMLRTKCQTAGAKKLGYVPCPIGEARSYGDVYDVYAKEYDRDNNVQVPLDEGALKDLTNDQIKLICTRFKFVQTERGKVRSDTETEIDTYDESYLKRFKEIGYTCHLVPVKDILLYGHGDEVTYTAYFTDSEGALVTLEKLPNLNQGTVRQYLQSVINIYLCEIGECNVPVEKVLARGLDTTIPKSELNRAPLICDPERITFCKALTKNADKALAANGGVRDRFNNIISVGDYVAYSFAQYSQAYVGEVVKVTSRSVGIANGEDSAGVAQITQRALNDVVVVLKIGSEKRPRWTKPRSAPTDDWLE